jgi:hypothetical protein
MLGENNLFLYWVGPEYKIIKLLRGLIYHHSNGGKNFTVHLINQHNITDYIDNFPGEFFWKLKPANQADFVRVSVINKWGGIWLDSDTIVMSSLSELFYLVNSGGFFIEQSKANDSKLFCNGVFGSKPNTPLLQLWNEDCHRIILDKKENIGWDEIGTVLLERYRFKKDYLFKQYKIIDGNSTVYPIHWTNSYQEFIEKPYENWKQIEREFQPVVIFNNEVYKKSEVMSECEILSKTPLSYFIKKSYLTKY